MGGSLPVVGSRVYGSPGIAGEITTRITIRFRPGVTRMNRILFRGGIYNIEGVLPDPKSGREYLTLPCSEGVNDG